MVKGQKLGLAAAVALGVLTGAMSPSLAMEPAEAIALRQAVMKSMGAHVASLKAGIAAGNGKLVAADAGAIAALAPNLAVLFPKGSGPEAGDTRAMAEIWSDWDKFKSEAMTLQTEAAALAKAAGTNDKAQMAAQFAKMAKMGCGGCHGAFRKKKN